MVGQCMFKVEVANSAPGGVYEASVVALTKSVLPIYNANQIIPLYSAFGRTH